MIQSDPFQLSFPYSDPVDLSLDEFVHYGVSIHDVMNQFDLFYPPFYTTDDSFDTLHANFGAMSDNNENFAFHFNEVPVEYPVDGSSFSMEGLDPYLITEIEDLRDLFEGDEGSDSLYQLPVEQEDNIFSQLIPSLISSTQPSAMGATSVQQTLILPAEETEIENVLGANHLAKAFAEAMDNIEHRELAEVIARRIIEKVSPVGEIRERLLYHSFKPLDKQADQNYLQQESLKLFDAAFEAIYRVLPNGKFTHFRANSAILEAIPYDDHVEVLHVVDFDMGNGVQWPSMIMAIAQQQQHGFISQQMTLKLTSIKWREEDDNDGHENSLWRFKETKKWLHDCAYSQGIKLEVKEMELQDLASEIKRMEKNTWKLREWLIFNCMHALPHMGRRRNRRHVIEFLNVARDLLAYPSNSKPIKSRGIITYGDGDNWEKITSNCSCFASFFDSYMDHYQALLESMEWNLPKGLANARITMECLFVAPYVSSLALFEEWREVNEVGYQFDDPPVGFGLQGVRFSKESLMEAEVMVREKGGFYNVRIEGGTYENEMVLEWKGTPLVRVSAWRL